MATGLYAIRLKEGQELRQALNDFVVERGLSSAVIVSAVGSLSRVTIRLAGASPDRQDICELTGALEIVSLIGTVSSEGKMHLHIAVADTTGNVIGGHLKTAIVHTTVELVLAHESSLVFTRRLDAKTGFDELIVADDRDQ